jgi:hypothetical protein
MIYEHGQPRWNDIDRETKEIGEEPVPLPICALKILME